MPHAENAWDRSVHYIIMTDPMGRVGCVGMPVLTFAQGFCHNVCANAVCKKWQWPVVLEGIWTSSIHSSWISILDYKQILDDVITS